MDVTILDKNGTDKGKVELKSEIFEVDVNDTLIYEAIKNELANKRLGTASTKSRGEITGSTKKPWRQKGTGRARSGTRKSPIWRGGGVVFGPKPRNYKYKLPRKVKKLSYKSIFSLKAKNNRIKIVDDFSIENGKTKEMASVLKKLSDEKRIVLIYKNEDTLLKRSIRNIPNVKSLSVSRLNANDLFYAKDIIIFKSALEELDNLFN